MAYVEQGVHFSRPLVPMVRVVPMNRNNTQSIGIPLVKCVSLWRANHVGIQLEVQIVYLSLDIQAIGRRLRDK